MSNLVPEKRVNKNGVAVTKHVRPATATTFKTALPAPALSGSVSTASQTAPAPTAADIVELMWQRKKELSDSPRRQPSFGYEQPFIDKFPDELRQGIHDFIKTAKTAETSEIERLITYHSDEPNRFSAFINTIGDVWKIDAALGEYDARRSCDKITRMYDSLGLTKFRGKISEYHFSVIKAEHVASALRLSPKDYSLPHEYYREIEVVRQNIDTIIPAVPVIIASEKSRLSAYVDRISDPTLPQPEDAYRHTKGEDIVEIAEYVQQYPERVEMIVHTIKERGEFDRELIDTMVTSGASAVASGTL
jgi:hypothetical protein